MSEQAGGGGKVYSVEFTLYATAYIKAESPEAAKAMADAMVDETFEVREDGKIISCADIDDPNLPKFSFLPAITISYPDDDVEQVHPDDHVEQVQPEGAAKPYSVYDPAKLAIARAREAATKEGIGNFFFALGILNGGVSQARDVLNRLDPSDWRTYVLIARLHQLAADLQQIAARHAGPIPSAGSPDSRSLSCFQFADGAKRKPSPWAL